MFKRLSVYLHEMYPPVSRLIVSGGLFFVVYYLVLLTSHVGTITVGLREIIGSLTVFVFLLSLRIADEFKDAETDKINFPHRPLPSGRVKKRDLITLFATSLSIIVVLNLVFMNNTIYFAVLLAYAALMSVWFFAKRYIQPNLLLALATHNPVQFILVFYIISFTCIAYHLPVFTWTTILIASSLYFPALAWEISRKIKAPQDENQYTTYSKILGNKPAVITVLVVLLAQLVSLGIVVYPLSTVAVGLLALVYVGVVWASLVYMSNPVRFSYGKVARIYIYLVQAVLIATEILLIVRGQGQ